VQLDPDNATAQNNLVVFYLDLGQYAQALPHAEALLRRNPHIPDNAFGLAFNYTLLHRNEDAAKAFDLAQPDTPLGKVLIAAGRLVYQSVLDPSLHVRALATVDALRRRTDLDPFSLSDVIQLDLVLGQTHSVLDLLPGLCASAPTACSDLSVNPLWLPLHGDPKFQALVKKYDTASQPPASAAPASSSS
jgi:tetratricopeptide (TPR) repeat protein